MIKLFILLAMSFFFSGVETAVTAISEPLLSEKAKKGEKTKRLKKLYSVQKSVVKENLKSLIGKTFSVTVEGFDENMLVYYGRAYFNAPDIDGKVYFNAKNAVQGEYYAIKIVAADSYDLYGHTEDYQV